MNECRILIEDLMRAIKRQRKRRFSNISARYDVRKATVLTA